MDQPLPPGLYIVATPIGNLSDLSDRARDTLRRADLVLAEDTRVSGKLLKHAGATTRMKSYHDHSSEDDRRAIVARLGSQAVALISDAGTPLISDPGYKLVRAARDAGHEVRTVPGPSAAIAALSISGLPTDRYLFLGFLPTKTGARTEVIDEVAEARATLVLYENGQRLGSTLAALAGRLGDREAAVARELTKLHEECVNGRLADLAQRYSAEPPKGEIVVIVAPPEPKGEASDEDLDKALKHALKRLSPSRAAAEIAGTLGVSRKRAYARALDLTK